MKAKFYTYPVVLALAGCLVFSLTSFAQRGRHRYDRGYDRHRYSYPYYRSYSYGHPYVSVHFGGYPYRYQRGYFFRPYGSVFQFVVPPIGIRIATLPFGYRRFYIGPDPYYYYNGIYYRSYANEYEVIDPPLGAVVDDLPPGAKVKVIDGQKYYELNGTYYKEEINENDQLSYRVVGTDGVLNTNNDVDENISPEPQIGDRIDSLPLDARTVVINGEKFYTTSAGLYYKEVIEGNKVYYELVGK